MIPIRLSILATVVALPLLGASPGLLANNLDSVQEQVDNGDYRAAAALLAQESIKPKDLRARFLNAAILGGIGREEEAIAAYRALIADFPEQPEAYNNLAAIHARKGEAEKAKQILEQAIRTSDTYATIYDNITSIYVNMARNSYAKALRVRDNLEPPTLALLSDVDGGDVVEEPIQVATAPVIAPKEVVEPTVSEVVPEPKPSSLPEERVEPSQPVAVAPVALQSDAATKVAKEAKEKEQQRDTQAAIAALMGWADAWSRQDIEAYLDAYTGEYQPDANTSHDEWKRVRRIRLKRPEWIKIELSDFSIENTGDKLIVEMVQDYKSNTYGDRSVKRMELVHRPSGWRIANEETLRVIQ